jgi:tetratricopeptide (TPR) repeat protein
MEYWMYTLIISLGIGILAGTGVYLLSYNYLLAILTAAAFIIGINYFIGKKFLKKLTELFKQVEKDLKADRAEKAIERLKSGYEYGKWQFFVKEQIDSQIGMILYTKKRFDEALPYLKNGISKNWMAMSMLATYYFRNKNIDEAKKVMEKAIKATPKEGFVYAVYAYILDSNNERDKAIEILTKGLKKSPLDEKLESNLELLKNGKKMKMQNYGTLWMQLNIEKIPQGAKPYQALIGRPKIRRR